MKHKLERWSILSTLLILICFLSGCSSFVCMYVSYSSNSKTQNFNITVSFYKNGSLLSLKCDNLFTMSRFLLFVLDNNQ